MTFADLQTQFRTAERAAFAVPSRNAHFKPSGITEQPSRRCVMGMPVHVSPYVPRGTILVVDGRVYADSDYAVMVMAYGYDPLFSRYTIGTKEAELDARRS